MNRTLFLIRRMGDTLTSLSLRGPPLPTSPPESPRDQRLGGRGTNRLKHSPRAARGETPVRSSYGLPGIADADVGPCRAGARRSLHPAALLLEKCPISTFLRAESSLLARCRDTPSVQRDRGPTGSPAIWRHLVSIFPGRFDRRRYDWLFRLR